jgi:hypothetical protein
VTATGTEDARRLTAWAAGCAERALAAFADEFPEDLAGDAIPAARSWAAGEGTVEACRDAAFEAQATARGAHDAGYRALTVALRAAATAAASADDPALAGDAAALAIEALTLNSAPCEQDANGGAERRRQWETLPADLRPGMFENEPPQPPAAACAIDPAPAVQVSEVFHSLRTA